MPRSFLRRALPLAAIALAMAGVYASGLYQYLSFDALAAHRDTLTALADRNPVLIIGAYILAYAGATALSVPGGAVLTILGGFLFGTWLGGAFAAVGATIGATGLFLAARAGLGDLADKVSGARMTRIRDGLRRDAFSYLLAMRLIPLVPFWLLNLAPALLGVKLRTYVTATALGILPGTVVYASLGNGVGTILDAGGTPNMGIVLQPSVLLPLLALAAFALLPTIAKRVTAWRQAPTAT
ncbi:Uncharacterized membrane protein YdjX, TVP38/TMEM64 family, SNARE-associated domain [Limimonas halophila]|uniref:TVP38/TMEM64 family membrane protein n=1 Tax=Limimonas halophila TaxID=1082479 RepID=A0A1G7UUK3_9PROT|nr:TVP38/TMEM64 family protein [Limimonas halophila]SDG50420.1 Uncharacterized membrane protein YdjX, TVP38/TMEM64 family, SNARE-associated domain [Limimonas halophila]